MGSSISAKERSKAIRSSEGWWFKAVFDSFDPVLEPFGYQLVEAQAGFRGDRVSYMGAPYRVAFEFDWDTRTLRGEFWDEARLNREDHLWVVRFWDLLRARDSSREWTEPDRSTMDRKSVVETTRAWSDALKDHALDVVAGGSIAPAKWLAIW